MNEVANPESASEFLGPNGDHRMPVPTTSMLPGSEKAPSPGAILLKNAVRGAHKTIDRLADTAAPVVHRVGESVSAAAESLNSKTGQLRVTRDEWVEGARGAVRRNPLAWVAAAVALGAALNRLSRITR